MKVEVLHRGRFWEIDAATVKNVVANTYEISIPTADAIHGKVKRKPTAEAWDEAVFLLDGKETEPATGSAESKSTVKVTAWIL